MQEEMSIHISVRNLVEFILRSGDIDNRHQAGGEMAMQEGSRIHRMLQRRAGADYQAEVTVRYEYATDNYTIVIDGRIDGIIMSARGTLPPASTAFAPVTVDEIKGTYRDVYKMKEPVAVHMAQAMCYAYIYAAQNELPLIRVRLTYCNMDTEDLQYFHQEYNFAELSAWFENLMNEYRKWADFEWAWRQARRQSVKDCPFPYPYRDGQKELITYVYQTIYHRRKLFIEAPTGVGKTLSTIYPAVKAVGERLAEKVFYLTAKTITRTVAEEAFAQLRAQGLRFKTVTLTAKDKICFMSETDCNPVTCPYAEGHFDRINEAIYTLLTESDCFDRDSITAYAERFRVCPFEMGLDIALFADGVIGDYNYLFDPHVHLRRFFAEGGNRDFVFLIDEAHNLVERGREMYSATLRKEDFLTLRKAVKDYAPRIAEHLGKCNRELLALKRETEGYLVGPDIEAFNMAVARLQGAMEDYLTDDRNNNSPARKEILLFYFEILHYQEIKDKRDENYVNYIQHEEGGGFFVKLFCVNPAKNLREYMQRGRASILFSATLLPIAYHRELLGANPDDYDVYARSVFNPEKMGLFIASDVTSKYSRRSDEEYQNIARYLREIVGNRHGNYLAFFPSHRFLREVYGRYMELYHDGQSVDCLVQEERMDEEKREGFLQRFASDERSEDRSLLGFCVSGGIFGEGIDLKNDSLIGAIIVGTCLPQVCPEREIVKAYFDEQGGDGFDYAYKFPGVNKVLQAAGRVIRTQEDIGIVALLDERFLQTGYRRLFPREWENTEVVKVDEIAKRVEKFWNDWLF